VIVLGALKGAIGKRAVVRVGFDYTRGPRNGPARMWLQQLTGRALDEAGREWLTWAGEEIERRLEAVPVLKFWNGGMQ